jgi:hypothetical protein
MFDLEVEMGYKVSKLVAEPFVNEIGQTINPGDKVLAVTTGYGHTVDIITGLFEGVRRHLKSDCITGTSLKDIPERFSEREYCDDGKFEEMGYDWNTYKSVPTGRRYNLIEKVKMRKSTLQRNRVFKIDTSALELSKVRL